MKIVITNDSTAPLVAEIHKHLLCAHSGYFENAVNKEDFKEGLNQQVELKAEDVDPNIFSLLVNWLYTMTIRNSEFTPLHLRLD